MNHIFLLTTVLSLSVGTFAGGLLWRLVKQDPSLQQYAGRFAGYALSIIFGGVAMYVWSFSNTQSMISLFVVLFLFSLLIFNWLSLNWLAAAPAPLAKFQSLVKPLRAASIILGAMVLLLFLELEWLTITIIACVIATFSWIQTLLAIQYAHVNKNVEWWASAKLWLPVTLLVLVVEFLVTQDGKTIQPFLSVALPLLFLFESIQVIQMTLPRIDSQNAAPPEQVAESFGLSARETEITLRVLQGLSNKQIAYELDISENTVRNHLSKVFQKTGVKKRTELFSRLKAQ